MLLQHNATHNVRPHQGVHMPRSAAPALRRPSALVRAASVDTGAAAKAPPKVRNVGPFRPLGFLWLQHLQHALNSALRFHEHVCTAFCLWVHSICVL